jgi:hypothetical protein
MRLKEVVAALFEIEEQLNLFARRIDGVYFWERVRVPVYIDILQRAELIHQPHTRLQRTLSNRGQSAIRALKNLAIRNPYFVPKSEVLFLGSARRKLGDDGKWWDIYCDPIIDHLNRSYVYFENPYLVGHLKPARTQCIKYLDLPLYLAAVRRKIGLVRVSLSKSDVRLLKAIQVKLQERFRVRIDVEGMVYRDLLLRKSLLPGYQALLKKVAPRIAVLVCSYGRETFVEACKTTGIPVVELQHGTISAYHLGYSFPGDNRTKRIFPDFLFLFGDFWKEGVDYPIPQERVFSVGYPYLEQEVKKYFGVSKRDQVVFLSQGTVGKEMSRFAVELSQCTEFPFSIVYKLHPGEYLRWRKEYPWLVASGIEVVEDDSIPLYQLLAESRMQIGLNSTAIFEGVSFGLKTLLLDLPGVEHMEGLVRRRAAVVVSSVGEVVGKVKDESLPRGESADFFKPNASTNAINALEKLLRASSTG